MADCRPAEGNVGAVRRIAAGASLAIVLSSSLGIAQAQMQRGAMPFPGDAGALNVRDFGAVGDGVHDDTDAFTAALAQTSEREEYWHVRIVQVPAGVYRITSTISKRFLNGDYDAGFVLIGAGQSNTILKLDEHAAGFQDPFHPKALIYTSGKGVAQAPRNGYTLRGEGNDGFSNFVENLTVDVGEHNPGAIGIDYLASNQGALRSVTVTGAGRIGIALTRAWFGPGLLEAVTVKGFDVGVDVGSLNYGVTADNLTLVGQRQIGIRNADNLVALHGLAIHTLGNPLELPIANSTASGMIALDGGVIEGPGTGPVSNDGTLYLRGLRVSGFVNVLGYSPGARGVIDGVFQGNTRISDASPAWALQGAAEPLPTEEALARWVGVPGGGSDATTALKAALDSGAHTVYLPFGVYEIRGIVDVPATVRRIVGMDSTIRWVPTGVDRAGDDPRKVLFRTHNSAAPLLIEHLFFSCPSGHCVAVEDTGTAPLILHDVVGMGTVFQRDIEAGELFLSDISGGFLLKIAGHSPVWGRQVDTEGGGARGGTGSVRITNEGAPMWLLGLKSEGDNTLVESSGGAVTDIVGALFASLRGASQPLFVSIDSKLVASGVEVAWRPGASYETILVESLNGRKTNISATAFPSRPKTQGVTLPRVVTGN